MAEGTGKVIKECIKRSGEHVMQINFISVTIFNNFSRIVHNSEILQTN